MGLQLIPTSSKKVVSIHSFEAQQADTQVTVARDEVLLVMDDSDANWIEVYSDIECKVRCHARRIMLYPSKYSLDRLHTKELCAAPLHGMRGHVSSDLLSSFESHSDRH